MKELLQNLIRLQGLELEEIREKNAAAVIADLRTRIPPQILGHYDRLMARGKKGIVPVRDQACTGCHMRLPIGVISELMKAEDIQLCDTCGRYLYLEETVAVATIQAPPTDAPPKRTKALRQKKAPSRKLSAGPGSSARKRVVRKRTAS
ncbi:MAG: C4-type zinc ribbon domain-containing protein [Verrucomicrobiota bacterium]|nr:C4-type zinc ribbon domain-containing protein [Limisphaera sp.]MDW8383100.1 C4-type zinc ribbon domain-containing protein [Verrucomicrobiota bacterium]